MNNVNRKFIDVKKIENYSILGENGFTKCNNIMKTIEYEICIVSFDDGSTLMCADDHILISTCGENVFAKDSIGYNIVSKDDNYKKVINFERTDEFESMYDVELSDDSDHCYYTNGVLSHNTTVVAGFLAHSIIFNDSYTVAVLANKKDTSVEILARIKMIYENLPWWMQQGVERWNVEDIKLGNGSGVLTGATSKSSIRGKAINCLHGDTTLNLRDKYTGEIKIMTFKELEDDLNKK